jgi:hypothetical protein
MRFFRLTAFVMALGIFMGVPSLTSAASNFTAYIACGYKTSAPPATSCSKGGRIGAFFRSNNASVPFRACVTFPNGQHMCTRKARASQGTYYVSRITVGTKGTLQVRWRSYGVVVASYSIKVT